MTCRTWLQFMCGHSSQDCPLTIYLVIQSHSNHACRVARGMLKFFHTWFCCTSISLRTEIMSTPESSSGRTLGWLCLEHIALEGWMDSCWTAFASVVSSSWKTTLAKNKLYTFSIDCSYSAEHSFSGISLSVLWDINKDPGSNPDNPLSSSPQCFS